MPFDNSHRILWLLQPPRPSKKYIASVRQGHAVGSGRGVQYRLGLSPPRRLDTLLFKFFGHHFSHGAPLPHSVVFPRAVEGTDETAQDVAYRLPPDSSATREEPARESVAAIHS